MKSPLILELTGSTGVGKSTLSGHLLERLAERGYVAMLADDYVFRCYGLSPHRIRRAAVKSVLVDLLVFPWFVRFALGHLALCWFIATVAWRDIELPLFRLNVLRNAFKHLGIHELIRSRSTAGEIVVEDEGPVHQAHSLFVHPECNPRPDEVIRFAREIPVPDLLVLVEGPTDDVVERTIARGHARLPGARIGQAHALIEHAETVLGKVTELAALRTATMVIRNVGLGQATLDATLADLLYQVDALSGIARGLG